MKSNVIKSGLLFILVSLSFPALSQDFFEQAFDSSKAYILLVHPSKNIIQAVDYLRKNKLLKIKDVEFVGVYHEQEKYDFQQAIDYVRDEKIEGIHFERVDGRIAALDVYKNNRCSEEFYNCFRRSVGAFFFGGDDIQPELYGENNTRSDVTDPGRHLFEVSFLFHLLGGRQNPDFHNLLQDNPDYLISGICMGMQTMVVATGGTLIQDIPEEVYGKTKADEIVRMDTGELHKNYWPLVNGDKNLVGQTFHQIQITPGSFFEKEMKWEPAAHPLVLSWHHQAVEDTTGCWKVAACSIDKKIIEGIQHKKYPRVFAVQFHPEFPALFEKMETVRISPFSPPQSFHQHLDKESYRFLDRYWKFIARSICQAGKARISMN